MDTRELAPLHEADLDHPTVEALFADIGGLCRLLEVQPRGSFREFARGSSLPLGEARDQLLAGEIAGVQLRYEYDGAQWWDTVLATPAGWRLVRIRHELGGPR